MTERIERLREKYRRVFEKKTPSLIVAAPGRVNLLGEHTDYNDGFVLPMAIDARIVLAGGPNDSGQVRVYSLDYKTLDVFSFQEITYSKTNPWSNYIRGVCALLLQAGQALSGVDLVLEGNVPQGAGLSSSAALEVAAALFFDQLLGLGMDSWDLIKLAQRAENEFVGVNCGIMDQFVSLLGQAGHALFLDCRTLEYEPIEAQFEKLGYAVLVINSGVRRGLVDSEYNLRRSQCEEAVRALEKELPGITALRDVGIAELDLIEALPLDLAKRARHVVTENQRVLDAVQALRRNDLQTLGRLLNASHDSLRRDYEVSCTELDLLVELAHSVSGTLGSRMTGAGFGGSTVSLVAQEAVPELKEKVLREYRKKTGTSPEIYTFKASGGARVLGEGQQPSR